MDVGVISIILTSLLVLFILVGFLWGIGRGVKKSAIRLAFFAGAIVLAFIFTVPISNLLLDISLQIDGTITTIKDYLINLIATEPTIADLYVASPSLQEFVAQMPIVIINAFVFVLLVYLFKFITWLAFSITINYLESRKRPLGKFGETVYTVKDGQPVVLTKVVEKKHRFLGGLISGFQAFILLFLTLIPLSGFVSIVNTLSNQTVETEVLVLEQEPEYTQLATLIRDRVDPEILGYFDAYSQNIMVKISGVGGLNLVVFDGLTSTQVGGENIVLRNELYSFAQIYENFSFLLDMDLEDFDAESLDFEQINTGIDLLFQSGIFKALALDFATYYLNNIINDETAFENSEYRTEILRILSAVDNNFDTISESQNKNQLFKQDLIATVGLMQVLVQSGLYDLVTQPEINETEILDLLEQNDYELLEEILNNLFISTTMKEAIVEGLNILFEYAENELYFIINSEEEIDAGTAIELSLDRVSSATLNFTSLKTDLFNIFKNFNDLYSMMNELDFELPIEEIIETFDTEILSKSGVVLNILTNSTIVKDTVGGENIYEQVLSYFNDSQYGEIANFNSLKSINWEAETETLIEIIDYIQDLIENEIVLKEFNYEIFRNKLNQLFESDIIKPVKIEFFDFILQDYEFNENLEYLTNFVYAHLDEEYDYVYEMKSEILKLLNAFEILGKSELIDLIIEDDLTDLSAVFEFLQAQNTGINDTNLNVLIDNLLLSSTFKVVFVELFNNAFLAQIEELSENLGRVDKGINWQGWNNFAPQFKAVLSNLIDIAQSANIFDVEQLDNFEFSDLINSNFSQTAIYVGEILDILATADFLNYNSGGTSFSIYDNLLDKYLGEILTIDKAKTSEYVEGFWRAELQILSSAISKANLIVINTEGLTLLDALINGEDLTELVETIYEHQHFNSILNALLDSELLKEQAYEFLNLLNKGIINLIDEEFDEDIQFENFEISSDDQNILDVINAILSFDIEEIDDIFDDFENQKDNMVALLNALQTSYNEEGIFGQVYEIYANFLTDTDGEFEYASVINSIIENEEMGDDIAELNWTVISDKLQEFLDE